MRIVLCHHYDVIPLRDVIRHVAIRLNIVGLVLVFEIFSVKNYDVMTPGSTWSVTILTNYYAFPEEVPAPRAPINTTNILQC